MTEIRSGVYRPLMACEACVFGRGEHAEWCQLAKVVEGSIERIPFVMQTGRPDRTSPPAYWMGIDKADGRDHSVTFEPDEMDD